MDQQAATAFIISELGKHRSRNDIIQTLCEQSNTTWSEVERLVQQVEAQHRRDIAARQSPLLILLGAGTIVVGIGLICYSILYFANFVQLDILRELLGLRSAYVMIGTFLTGLAMIAGGIIGFWKTFIRLIRE